MVTLTLLEKYNLILDTLQGVYDHVYDEDVLFDPGLHNEGEQRRHKRARQALEKVRETLKAIKP